MIEFKNTKDPWRGYYVPAGLVLGKGNVSERGPGRIDEQE